MRAQTECWRLSCWNHGRVLETAGGFWKGNKGTVSLLSGRVWGCYRDDITKTRLNGNLRCSILHS